MPILGIIASSKLTASNSYESISTVTVGATSVASIDFTSIPATYTHLQIRGITRGAAASASVQLDGRFNGDTGSNYSNHAIYADGATVSAFAESNFSAMNFQRSSASTAGANIFGVFVIDILDYANTNKYKTVRQLGGYDNNGSGVVGFTSQGWRNTAAITSISLYANSGNLTQYSQFALYGIKGA